MWKAMRDETCNFFIFAKGKAKTIMKTSKVMHRGDRIKRQETVSTHVRSCRVKLATFYNTDVNDDMIHEGFAQKHSEQEEVQCSKWRKSDISFRSKTAERTGNDLTHVIMLATTINLCLAFNSCIFFFSLVVVFFGKQLLLEHVLIKNTQTLNFSLKHCNQHLI